MGDQTVNMDGYFGGCPECGKTDGYINIGKGHWFFCKEHKKSWLVGANLFSSWRDETLDEQRAKFDAMGFDQFEIVEPIFPDLPVVPVESGGSSAPDDFGPLPF